MEDKHYSTIVLRNHVKHIFDHKNDKILCGQDRWNNKPFTLQKTKYSKESIVAKHHKHAEDRGYPNYFKFICRTCLKKLDSDFKTRVDKLYKKGQMEQEERTRQFEAQLKKQRSINKERQDKGWIYIGSKWNSDTNSVEKGYWLLPAGEKFYELE